MTQLASGAAQIGTGLFQAGGETITQLINYLIRENAAGDVTRAGERAGDDFRNLSTGLLDRSEDRLATLFGAGSDEFGRISNTLRTGRNEALGEFKGIVPEAISRGNEALGRRDEDIASLRDQLQSVREGAANTVQETKTLGQQAIERITTEGRNLFDSMQAKAEEVITGIRTNMTERAGATVGGMRAEAEARAREFQAKAEQEGVLTPQEIMKEVNRIKEGAVAAVSAVWGNAFTAMSEQIATARVASNNMLSSLGATLNKTYSDMESGVLNNILNSMVEEGRIGLGTAQLDEQASAVRGELAKGIMSNITGTMEFVADKTSQIIGNEAAAQATNNANRLAYNTQVTEALAAHDQVRISAGQYSIDTVLNSVYQAAGIRAGFALQFPNIVGLTAGGFQTIGQIGQNSGGQKRSNSFSASVMGTGGGFGSGCVDSESYIQVPGGAIPLKDVKIGMTILGSDNKYHRVTNMDIGVAPIEQQFNYVCITGMVHHNEGVQVPFGFAITLDHLIDGIKPVDLKVGDELPCPTGTAVVHGIQVVPYRVGADLELEGCKGYVANGISIDSAIGQYPPQWKKEIYDSACERGFVLDNA